ncbi:MAG: LysM peptidoglycan-binding domain-containing protein [Flavobacteriales bacterium]|jgi:nucleoid-associated protein YgaU|nr:LysM peptidoglycan-binding domain-containing protein [Flavobacteriales bacterium]NCG30746.1 LysM peptidoglycan-binding domain-containing protein [Bacteroidota bacterium]MBT3964238.1 LysM peptidoglycan-binding domain-containing protein [Flavobacteriales bacterium]MBT4704129.1 LysM peptidoglycan-binding domain-containing protein [Flavobacteriales bacterium]MBT4930051.1 LysM peptidoglycan-binding domain-containing protein [Flavobacteriales bacterium]
MNCPVCDDPNIPEGAESCESCGSDLRAFQDIQRVQKQRGTFKTASIALAALSLLLIIFLAGSTMMASNGTVDGEVPMESDSADSQDMEQSGDLQQVLKEKDDKIALLESEVEELIATMQSSHEDVEKPDQTIHVVEEGESLWSISEMYHGHGFEHAEIAGHNEIDDIHHIKVGDSIIIKH